MIRFAMKLPATFDDFVASHNRANNLRKSMRRADRAGISFAIVEDVRERAEVLTKVLNAWGRPDDLPEGLSPDIGTHMVALDSDGHPLAMAILLHSGPTAQLALLAVDKGHQSRSVIRYALTAFAIRVAIERGADVLLLTGAAFSASPVFASSRRTPASMWCEYFWTGICGIRTNGRPEYYVHLRRLPRHPRGAGKTRMAADRLPKRRGEHRGGADRRPVGLDLKP